MTVKTPISILAALLVSLCALALAATPALAGEGYGVTTTFGTAGAGNGEFSGPAGVAVNQSSEDVYVVDKGNNRVEYFNSTGTTYIGEFNGTEIDGAPAGAGKEAPAQFSEPRDIAIDNSCFYHSLSGAACTSFDPSNGDVYVSDLGHGVIDKLTATGDYVSQLGPFASAVLGVAVDCAGNVWVYEASGEVSEYSDTGALVSQFNTGRGVLPGLAVDANDDVFLVPGSDGVSKYDPSTGAELAEFASNVSGLAVDLSTNDVYVGQGATIVQYGPLGEPYGVPVHRSGQLVAAGAGIAVNSTHHRVYLADSAGNDVAILGLGATGETPETKPASAIKHTTATLEGVLNPHSKATVKYYFEYKAGPSCTGGTRTAEAEATEAQAKAVSAPLTGLSPGTEYTVCLVAEDNKFGPAYGSPVTFTTGAASAVFSPTVTSESVSSITPFDATLEAKVLTENQATSWSFEYATAATGETLEGTITPVGSGTLTGNLEEQTAGPVDIGGGLTPSTTYYYRAVATNASGTTDGKVESFMTSAAQPPAIESESSPGVGSTFAVVEAQIDPDYQETTCELEYATKESEIGKPAATTVACPEPLGSGGAARTASVLLIPLQPRTTYYYRVIAQNVAAEKTEGPIHSFTTIGAPIASTGEAQDMTRTSATLTGTVNPGGTETTYHFAYIEQKQYEEALADGAANPYAAGVSTPESASVGADYTDHPVSGEIQNLQAGTTYDYALVATNTIQTLTGPSIQTSTGPNETFTTAPKTPPILGSTTVSGITESAATITGSLESRGLSTHWELKLADSPGALSHQASGSTSASTTEPLTVGLEQLSADTPYYYKLIAVNPDGSIETPEASFTTLAAPLPAPQISTPLLALPDIPFPTEETVRPTTTSKKTAKCPKGKHRSHGKCTKAKAKNKKKTKKAKKAKKANQDRRASR
jgi:phosphodiesterase/alkaline phosphatase D-like protein